MILSPHHNPLLENWPPPYHLPPFTAIRPEHFAPAFVVAFAAHREEIAAITGRAAAPGFGNTVLAFDRAGAQFKRLKRLFNNMASACSSATLEAAQHELSPEIARHESAVYADSALFTRINAVHAQRSSLRLSVEQQRLVERLHLDFVRAGALLTPVGKHRIGEIAARQATLETLFAQNLLHDENAWQLVLGSAADLSGLPPALRDALAHAAAVRGIPGAHVVTLTRSVVLSFLTFSERRDLRHQVMTAWAARGNNPGAHNNCAVVAEVLALRQEHAALLGYKSYADYGLADRMAGSTQAVFELLAQVWEPAKARVAQELAAIEHERVQHGQVESVAPWDWRFYAEKVRARLYDVQDAEIKPYFELNATMAAMFDCAHRLFGVHCKEVVGSALYHADVRLFEAMGSSGHLLGVFLADNFARAGKKGGAWMGVYRYRFARPDEAPSVAVVANHNNFAQASEGQKTLLSLDDVHTLFHEFGHALHVLLSEVQCETLSGSQVLWDYVELPSQLFEHWALQPDVLTQHARHVDTGEPMPPSLLQRIRAAAVFNAGYETVQYVASCYLDMAAHDLQEGAPINVAALTRETAERIGLPAVVPPIHQLTHFRHLFADGKYAAGYYVYLWAEVLDADAFVAFEETGNVFDPATAQRLKHYVYGAGNTIEPGAGYAAFRGRGAQIEPMLKARGL